MKAITLISLFLLLITDLLKAQVTFEKAFGISGDNFANDVRPTEDGGYIVTGTANYTGSGGDIFLIKTNATGDTSWTKMIGGAGIDNGNTVKQTSDGGYIIAGSTTSFGAGGSDAYLVRTDANGSIQWSKTYGTSSNDAAYGIVQTANGGFVFSGTEKQSGLYGTVHLVKVSANGDVLWSKTFGNSTRKNYAYTLLQTNDHGFLIGGWGNLNLGINDDFYLIKTDSNGTKQWYKSYGDVGHDQNYSVCQASDGGFVMAGITFSSYIFDVNVVKTDAAGNLQWTKNIGGNAEDDAYAVTATSDGGFVFCGTSSSFGALHQPYIVKLDGSGNLIWSKIMSGTEWSGFFAIQEANDGGLILTGVKDEVYQSSGSLYLVKTDANGNSGCNTSVTSSVTTPSILVGPPIAFGTSTQIVTSPSPAVTSGTTVTNICQSCLPATTTPTGNATFCSGTSLTITANLVPGISYQWFRNGSPIAGATNQTYSISSGGTYYVNETSADCNSNSDPTVVTKLKTPSATITPLGNLDICATGSVDLQANAGMGFQYQWMKGINNINGATNQIYTAIAKGTYKVIVTGSNGCTKLSKVVKVIKSCKEATESDPYAADLYCYPNPASDQFTLDIKLGNAQTGSVNVDIFNAFNQKVYAEVFQLSYGQLQQVIRPDRPLPSGMYVVRVGTGNHVFSYNLIIQQ